MKIDLHIHTKMVNSSDGINRNIDSDTFRNKMIDNDIKIAAITNHNIFDIKQFNDFISAKDYLLLPGIELDVLYKNKRKQLNIIYSPELVSDFDDKCKNLSTSPKNPIIFSDILKIFENSKCIFYLDHKNGTRFEKHEINEIIELSNNKQFVVISDTNNTSTKLVLNASNFNALIGSDVDDWNRYSVIAKKLLKTNVHINNFGQFVDILKYDSTILSQLLKNVSQIKINDIEIDKKYKIENLYLNEGVNIIFGPRATGKTEILKSINRQFENKSAFYESIKNEENFKNISIDKRRENEWEQILMHYKGLINDIVNYKQNSFTKYFDFHRSFDKSSSIKIHNFKNEICIDPKNISSEKITNILNASDSILKSISATRKYFIHDDSNIFNNYIDISKTVLNKLWEDFTIQYLHYWKHNFKKTIHAKVSKVILKSTGVIERPRDIKLLERFLYFNKIKKTISDINKIEKSQCKTINTINVPNRGEVYVKKTLHLLDIKNKNSQLSEEHRIKTQIQDIQKQWNELNIKNITNIKKWFEDNQILNDKYFLIKTQVVDEIGNMNFSSGEKALISLSNTLNKNANYFLLDEPDVFLDSKTVTDYLLPKISELVEARKTVVISTHNSAIGVNTIPINYIYRQPIKDENYLTYIGSIWTNAFKCLNIEKEIDFIEAIVNNFEGGHKHFKFRKEIYEKN